MAICPKCGKQNLDRAQYCAVCGAPLAAGSPSGGFAGQQQPAQQGGYASQQPMQQPMPGGSPNNSGGKSKAPIIIGIVVAAVVIIALVVVLVVMMTKDGGTESSGGSASDGLKENSTSYIAEEVSDAEPLKAEDSGYWIEDDYIYYAVMVSNPNSAYAATNVTLDIVIRNSEGNVIGTSSDYLSWISPGETTAICGMALAASTPASVDFSISVPSYGWTSDVDGASVDDLQVEGLTVTADSSSYSNGITIGGEISNSTDTTYSYPYINVVFYDATGNIIGGTCEYVSTVQANSSTAFSIHIYDPPNYSSLKVYIDRGSTY